VNWILKYRINPDWFLDDDNKLKILKLIKNHEIFSELSNRDIRLSYLLNDNINDPLNYLNKYLDYIYGKDYEVLESPQHYSTYVCDDIFDWFDVKSKEYKIFLYQFGYPLYMVNSKLSISVALISKV
jgi:hypothetical protein